MKARVSILFLLIPQICFGTVYHVGPGEIYTTFAAFHAAVTPAAGDYRFLPPEWDLILGSKFGWPERLPQPDQLGISNI